MTILLCFDGSDQSKHAIGVSGELFAGAQAHVLNVWEPVERIVARYAVLAPFMGEELGASATSSTASQTMVTSFAVCALACSPAAATISTPAPAVAADSASALSSAAPSSSPM